MNESLLQLLQECLFYAGLNLGLRVFLRQPLVCAALAFWVGWIFLIAGGMIIANEGWANIRTQSAPYMSTLFNGAFVGFLIGTSLAGGSKPRTEYLMLVEVARRFFKKFGKRVLLMLFLIGAIFFAQRLETVGFSASYLGDVRAVYSERNYSFLQQAGSHLMVLTTMFIILRGVYDSYYGVNVRVLFLAILCGAPLGMANGSRIFLLNFFLAYVASLLLSRAHFSELRYHLMAREVRDLGGGLLVLLTVFAIMGYQRGGYGEELNIAYTILIWPVSTLGAMDSWVSSAIMSEGTYGLNTFGWVFDFLSRIGLIDISSATTMLHETLYYFQTSNNSAAVIPRSILPDLIFDFGPGALFFSMMTVAIILETLTSRNAGRGIFRHVLAVQCLVASFSTIQNSVLSPGFSVSILWAAVFSLMAKRYRWR